MNRVGQFFRALGARLRDEDLAYLKTHLSPEGRELFFGMNLSDQAHALHVARTAETLAEEQDTSREREFLLRCALLHDVGRTAKDMGVGGKVFAVLCSSLAPGWARRWAKAGSSGLWGRPRHILHVFFHHPEIGAEKLKAAGFCEEAEIVRLHHRPSKEEDPWVLRVLREADERN